MRKIPSGFRLSDTSQERNGGAIYCCAWSEDLHERTITMEKEPQDTKYGSQILNNINSNNDNSSDVSIGNNHGVVPNEKGMSNIAIEDPSLKSFGIENEKKTQLVRYMATCGGNYVTIYEVGDSKLNCNKNELLARHVSNGVKIGLGKPTDNDNKKITTSSTKGRGLSFGLGVRQVYQDADKDEVFYTCAFGGRSSHGFVQPKSRDRDADANPSIQSGRKLKRPRPDGDLPPQKASNMNGDIDNQQNNSPTTKKDKNSIVNSSKVLSHIFNSNGPQLCCVAGKCAIIKVIDTVQRSLILTLVGHGDEIYDLSFSPSDSWLLVSASKDESLRLWNVQTATCIAMFAGHEGHCDSVLSVAFHPLGQKIVSSGMDTTIKIWNLDGEDMKKSITESFRVRPKSRGIRKKLNVGGPERITSTCPNPHTLCEQLPSFSSKKMHTDYVDCVQFVGDLILSKSITNTISLWKPDLKEAIGETHSFSATTDASSTAKPHKRLPIQQEDVVIPLRDFELSQCNIWFVRFQTDAECTMLAAGNCAGEIRVWEIGGSSAHSGRKHFCTLTNPMCTSTVRMVSFSPDGNILIATCDDGTVWKWDAKY